jgi:hypothetical protein
VAEKGEDPHERYRTLLGRVRHEVGHYYWERLIAGTDRLDAFRAQCRDERADYGATLQAYYVSAPPANWQNRSRDRPSRRPSPMIERL